MASKAFSVVQMPNLNMQRTFNVVRRLGQCETAIYTAKYPAWPRAWRVFCSHESYLGNFRLFIGC